MFYKYIYLNSCRFTGCTKNPGTNNQATQLMCISNYAISQFLDNCLIIYHGPVYFPNIVLKCYE